MDEKKIVYKKSKQEWRTIAMPSTDIFWKASVEELKQGFTFNQESQIYTCLICEKEYEEGVIYPVGDIFLSAKKAIINHILEIHGSLFEYFLNMGKVYTGLTEHQRELMKMFHEGLSDKDIVDRTEATSTSTIRNQRFSFKEKYKQAKIIVAMYELLDSSKYERLIDFHKTATSIDERYAITEKERDSILSTYFDKDNNMLVGDFPSKEKKKIVILQHIMNEFDVSKKYTEKDINEIIKKFYADYATIRRYFIQYGFLERNTSCTEYWVRHVRKVI